MSGISASMRRRVLEEQRRDSWVMDGTRSTPGASDVETLATEFSHAIRGLGLVVMMSRLGALDAEDLEDRDEAAGVECRAGSREEVEKVRSALLRIPRADREILEALYFEGLSTTELAARCGVNKSTISRRHARALDSLLDAFLGPEDGECLSSAG